MYAYRFTPRRYDNHLPPTSRLRAFLPCAVWCAFFATAVHSQLRRKLFPSPSSPSLLVLTRASSPFLCHRAVSLTWAQVVDAGMRVMRINFSHATFEEAELRLANLRAVSMLFVVCYLLFVDPAVVVSSSATPRTAAVQSIRHTIPTGIYRLQ